MTDEELEGLAARVTPLVMARLEADKPWKKNIFLPSMDVYRVSPDTPFMQHSSCSSHDFFHPRFAEISAQVGLPQMWHRKFWEWVYVVHHVRRCGGSGPGRRGLAFGVGQETLPAVFAADGCTITATDADEAMARAAGWVDTKQYASGLAGLPNGALDRGEFERRVSWRACDMNEIDPELTGYDFCWSSCSFEHLGSLRHGMDFVINSVEKTLKIGGVAVHTTEFNLSSNDATIEDGATVIYRLRDIQQLSAELTARGHQVDPIVIAPDSLVMDGYVDTPTYGAHPHLKLLIGGFTTTSLGIVVRRGR